MDTTEPVTLEQALIEAMQWTKKAGLIAAEEGREGMARSLGLVAMGIERALATVKHAPTEVPPRLTRTEGVLTIDPGTSEPVPAEAFDHRTKNAS